MKWPNILVIGWEVNINVLDNRS